MGYDNNRGGGRDDGPKELHDVVCAECNKNCQVPFKPRGDRPVTCRDCFAKTKPQSSRGGGDRKPYGDKRGGFGDRQPTFNQKPAVDYTKQFEELNFKLNKVIRQLDELDKQINPRPEKTRNAPDNTVDTEALKDTLNKVQE